MHRYLLLLWGACCLAGLACATGHFVPGVDPLAGPSYWAAETGTPVPTVTVFLGTTTPVYAPTDPPLLETVPPAWITVPPGWTTVTATPLWPPETATPAGWTATPFWITTTPGLVTTTPVYVTTTPRPPATTTPALPVIGFTTPVPTETPYYRVGEFYLYQDVYIGRPRGIAVTLTGHWTAPAALSAAAVYHYFALEITNHGPSPAIVPLTDAFFVRRVGDTGGYWSPRPEPLADHTPPLPALEALELAPLDPGATRALTLGFVLPAGHVERLGMVTDWQRPVPGGLPIWFRPITDPAGDFVSAFQPPPPTPVVLDDGGTYGAGGGPLPGGTPPPAGLGRWPTTGVVTRGFGCATSYTGVSGAGFGCPPERPWFHNGVDIANVKGHPIWSPDDGVITYAGPNPTGDDCSSIPGSEPPHNGLGDFQKIAAAGLTHYLGHLSAFVATTGNVAAGAQVAQMGSSGCSTGPHLHWMIRQGTTYSDPAQWAGPGPAP